MARRVVGPSGWGVWVWDQGLQLFKRPEPEEAALVKGQVGLDDRGALQQQQTHGGQQLTKEGHAEPNVDQVRTANGMR